MKTAKTTYALFTIACAAILTTGFLAYQHQTMPQPIAASVELPKESPETAPVVNKETESVSSSVIINFNPTHDHDHHHHHEQSVVYVDGALGLSIDNDQTEQGGYRSTSVEINGNHYHLDIADSEMLRKQGLSGRGELYSDRGMFFVFDFPYRHGIWMKDMNFPLDIIWLDKEKQIVHIEQNVSPDTYPTVFTPPTDALYVIEIPTGSLQVKQKNSQNNQ